MLDRPPSKLRRFLTRTLPGLLDNDKANTVLSLLAVIVSFGTLYLTYFHVDRQVMVRVTTFNAATRYLSVGFVLLNTGNRDVVVLSESLDFDFEDPTAKRTGRNAEAFLGPFGMLSGAPAQLKDRVVSARAVVGSAVSGYVFGQPAYAIGKDLEGSDSRERRGIYAYLRIRLLNDEGKVFESRRFVGEVGLRPLGSGDVQPSDLDHLPDAGQYVLSFSRDFARTYSALSNEIEGGPPPGWSDQQTTPPAAR